MVNLGTAIGYLDIDTSKFKQGFKDALNEVKKFSDETKSTNDKLKVVADGMTNIGASMSKNVTVPLVGAGALMLKTASDFEYGMSQVKAITGATGDDFERLKSTALDLGASTAFSASEVADAMTEMAKAGWDTNQIISGMGGVLNAAAASGEELASVSTIVADAITGFGMAASDSTKVADLLTQAANSGTIGISDLGESFKYIAPVAGAMGYNIEDVTTALAAMSKAGIKGSQAGTALRTMLTNMANPTDNMAAAMDLLGVSLYDTEGNMYSLNELLSQMRTGFNELALSNEEFAEGMADLNNQLKTGNINQSQYNSLAYDLMNRTMSAEEALWAQNAAMLAGKEGMSGLLSVMTMTEEEYQNLSNEMYNSAGIAEETAAVMQDNLQSKIEQLGGALETLGITFGTLIIPYVQSFVVGLTSIIEKISNLDPGIQSLIVTLAAIVAALGPLLLIVGNLIKAFLSIQQLVTIIGPLLSTLGVSFTALTGPIGIAIAAIAGLFIAYQTNLFGIRDLVNSVLADITELWNINFANIQDYFGLFWDTIQTIIGNQLQILKEVINVFLSVLKGDWQGAWDSIKNIFTLVWNNIETMLKTYIEAIIIFVTSAGPNMLQAAKDLFNKAKDGFQEIWNKIKEWFSKAVNDPVGAVIGIGSSMYNAGVKIFNMLWDGIKSIWEGIQSWVEDKVDWIIDKVQFWKSKAEEADEARSRAEDDDDVDGSHRNGLDYVPYDGYRAELHKGERVLTAEENKNYGSSGNIYNFYSPKALSAKEAAREMKRAQKEIALGFN